MAAISLPIYGYQGMSLTANVSYPNQNSLSTYSIYVIMTTTNIIMVVFNGYNIFPYRH